MISTTVNRILLTGALFTCSIAVERISIGLRMRYRTDTRTRNSFFHVVTCVSCDLYPLNTRRLHARARRPSLGLSFNFVQWRDRQSVTPFSTRYSAMSRTSRPSPRIPVRLIHFDWFEVMWVASSCIYRYSATWHSLARYCHAIPIPCPSQTIIWIYKSL